MMAVPSVYDPQAALSNSELMSQDRILQTFDK